MTNKPITHLYAPNPGGVTDFVDVIMRQQGVLATKLAMSKNNAPVFFPEHCLLHYSGYGFAKRGAPLWLLHKLENDRAKIKTLGIFFHELYAFGMPWNSSFWLSPVQRHIAIRLAKLSDFWITNREGSAQWLERFAGNKPHAVMPVFSNIGEMPSYSSVRAPKVVVFGGVALRRATYQAAGESLFVWANQQGFELHDIGPAINDPLLAKSLNHAGVIEHGCLNAEDVSKQLADASFGVVVYPVNYVAKSGVFAAYCAHGVCPILISKSNVEADGLVAGHHYLTGMPDAKVNSNTTVGQKAWEWYQPHNVLSHANTLANIIEQT